MATLPPPSATSFGLNIGSNFGCGASGALVANSMLTAAAPTKPKQSKSRNGKDHNSKGGGESDGIPIGCITCKAKRLKCDETKPTCTQCHKRGVVCGGYKKDFKWRPFEESSIGNKASKPARKSELPEV